MTLYTVAASGRSDVLANGKARYWVLNAVTGETIWLEPASDGLCADRRQDQRFGHQLEDTDGASIAPSGQTGIASWTLGTDSTFVTLSAADVAAIYTPLNNFGSTGALAAPVVTALADQVTVVKQDNRMTSRPPPFGNGQSIAQLAIIQGSNIVLLSQQNCSDLAAQLNTIGAT